MPRSVDPLALDQYLTYGYVPHPRTILEGTHKLPPAHYAVWRGGALDVQPYWQLDGNSERIRTVEEDIEELRATLSDAVREQMIADVPLGAFLSGGIDSTIIVGLMQQSSSRPVKTFAIGFPDPRYDETRYAELAARYLGTEHQTFIVEPKAWETLPDLAWQFDEPFADSSSLPTWYVSRETRRAVTVALTGDAGDELFGGYDRYRALALTELFQRLPAGPRHLLGGTMVRVLPQAARSKTRLRGLRRLFEHINEPAQDRYLGWMTSFDEAARLTLYSDEQLDLLATAGASLSDPSEADPASLLTAALAQAGRRDRSPSPWLPISRPICPAICWSRSTWPAWRTAWSAAGRFWTIGSSSWPWPCRLTERSGSVRAVPRSCSSRHSRTCYLHRSRPGQRWALAFRSAIGSATS